MTTIINGSSPSITFSDSTTQTSAGLVVGTASAITAGTAVASTSGTSIDFTSIPSWVKRITVMFNNVSTNGASGVIVQLGSGSPTTSGYLGMVGIISTTNNTTRGTIYTTGFGLVHSGSPNDQFCGAFIFSLLGSNTWTLTGSTYDNTQTTISMSTGSVPLSGTLDRVRITTVNGTDTFDAGSINILYE